MLIAEVKGKGAAELQNNEDYLTSAVFGHLRYIPAAVFWRKFFAKTKSAVNDASSLAKYLDGYTSVSVEFWYFDATYGEPDLWLTFTGEGQRPLHIIIEVKLDAKKTGTGEQDQLIRYLRCQDKNCAPGETANRFVVYLTPRDARKEVEESLSSNICERDTDCHRLYWLQWQDLLEAAEEAGNDATEQWMQTLLRDIAKFLRRRGLEYFRGFKKIEGTLSGFDEIHSAGFTIQPPFAQIDGLTLSVSNRCGWIT